MIFLLENMYTEQPDILFGLPVEKLKQDMEVLRKLIDKNSDNRRRLIGVLGKAKSNNMVKSDMQETQEVLIEMNSLAV